MGLPRDGAGPHEAQGGRFKPQSILALAFAAVLAGRRSPAAIARWAEKIEENKDLLRPFGIERDEAPCHAAFHYVFKGMKVKALDRALSRCGTGGQHSFHNR